MMPGTAILWLLHPSHITISGKLYSTLEYGCTYTYFLNEIFITLLLYVAGFVN